MKLTYVKRTGHERYRMVKANNNPAKVDRRKGALKRLENQLLTGYKTVNVEGGIGTAPLTEEDKVRINKEIEILKTRL